jgi:protein SCO1
MRPLERVQGAIGTAAGAGCRFALTLTTAVVVASAGLAGVAGSAFAQGMDAHAHHHMMMMQTKRTVVDYTVPDLNLVRDDGKTVALRHEIDDGRPVVLTFIYTSCTTVCPLITHTMADLQGLLGPARERVHLVSISIDPEQDTPARLRAYAKSYGAGPEWQHYTGTLAASQTAQRAFDVYRGDKMEHTPTVLVRDKPGAPWVRIDGFATADDLLAELPAYRTRVGSK